MDNNFASKMNMNMKMNGKILIVMSIILTTLASCVMDRVTLFCIRNCSRDTLYIELAQKDTLDNLIYWDKDSRPIFPEDTTWTYINGKKVIIDNFFYALPDSIVLASPYSFNNNDTCYIYAIKRRILTHYSLDEVRAKKLYDRRAVTKKDFWNNREFKYRPAESARSH
jgi:hypothetical protein